MAREPVDEFIDFDQPGERQRVMSSVGTYRGIWHLTLEPKRDTRSLKQNSFYHKAVVTPLYEVLRENHIEGIACKNDAHELLKAMLLRVDVVDPDTGEMLGTRPGSTRKLSVEAFSRYVEDCRDWIQAKVGIDVLAYEPEPAATRSRRRAAVGAE